MSNKNKMAPDLDNIVSIADREQMAYDYLRKADNTASEKTRIRYAKKALELCPYLIEAEYMITSCDLLEPEAQQAEMERLLEKGERLLREQGITAENSAGDFYTIHETRSYIGMHLSYIHCLIEQGKLRKSVEVCKKVLMLNESDNLGVRYLLMALYALLEEKKEAEKLYKQFPEEGSFMLLPLIALYYKLDDIKKATKYIQLLCRENEEVFEGFRIISECDEEEIEILSIPYFKPYSKEEVVLGYANCSFLFDTLDFFDLWMMDHIP